MASYHTAVQWIAANDAAGDTPPDLDFTKAYEAVNGNISVVLVADVFNKPESQVALDVLKARGFSKPKGFDPDNL